MPRSSAHPPDPPHLAFQPWVADLFHPFLRYDNQPKKKKRPNLLPSLCFSSDPIWASLIFSSPRLTSRSSSVCSVRPLGIAMITCSYSRRHSNKGRFPNGLFQRQLAHLSPRAAQQELLRAALEGRGPAPCQPLRQLCVSTFSLASVQVGYRLCNTDGPEWSRGRQGLNFLQGTWCQVSKRKSLGLRKSTSLDLWTTQVWTVRVHLYMDFFNFFFLF